MSPEGAIRGPTIFARAPNGTVGSTIIYFLDIISDFFFDFCFCQKQSDVFDVNKNLAILKYNN